MKAAILARVSTARQGERDRHSLPMQREMMEAHAAREGWNVVAVYEIPGESAYGEHRPEFFKAIEAGERGEYSVLLVYDVSRMARNQWVFHDTLRRMRIAGVRVYECLGGQFIDEQSPILVAVKSGQAEEESQRQSTRIRHAKAHRAAMGLHVGSLPFGYEMAGAGQPGKVVEAEAAAIAEVFRRRANGEGYSALARWLNTSGFAPRSRQGYTAFTPSAVQSLIENDFYAGFTRHRGERREALHEAVIEESLWEAAQAAVRPLAPKARVLHLLSGKARCVHCEATMWTTRSGRANRFTYYRETRKGCLPTLRWRQEEADARFEEAFLSMAQDREWHDFMRSAPVVRENRATEPDADDRWRRASQVYLAGGMTRAEWEAERARHKAATAPQKRVVAGEMPERLFHFGELWGAAPPERQREMVATVFDAVGLDVARKEMYVRPWPEFEDLFEARLQWRGRHGTPGRNEGLPANTAWVPVRKLVAA